MNNFKKAIINFMDVRKNIVFLVTTITLLSIDEFVISIPDIIYIFAIILSIIADIIINYDPMDDDDDDDDDSGHPISDSV